MQQEDDTVALRIESAGSPARLRRGWATATTTWSAAPVAPWRTSTASHAPYLDPRAAPDAGFLIDEGDVTFWGLCPDCQAGVADEPIELEPFHAR